MFKFCEYQEVVVLCEEHGFEGRVCNYNHKIEEPYLLCPIQPEDIKLVPNGINKLEFLAYCSRCPHYTPYNLIDHLLLTDLSFSKDRYYQLESDLEYILVDKRKEEQSIYELESEKLSFAKEDEEMRVNNGLSQQSINNMIWLIDQLKKPKKHWWNRKT